MSNSRAAAVAILSILLFSLAGAAVSSENSSATVTENTLRFDAIGTEKLSAETESRISFEIMVTNTNAYLEHDNSDNILVTMRAEVVDKDGKTANDITVDVKTSSGADFANLEGNESVVYVLTVDVGKYALPDSYTVNFYYTAKELSSTSTYQSGAMGGYSLTVTASNIEGGFYNKIAGIWDNPFGGVFGESWFAALLTFVIYIAIGVLLALIFVPLICRAMEGNRDRRLKLIKSLRNVIITTFALLSFTFSLSVSLSVMGIDNEIVEKVDFVCSIVYVLIGAFIVWRVYSVFLDRTTRRVEDQGDSDAVNTFKSVRSMAMFIGAVVIIAVAVFLLLTKFGFDTTAVITSAGLVTLGVTFGAQQILSQFFAGMMLLITKPFKTGDLIQLGTDTVYRVRNVNVMNTELENTSNSDVTVVPNNTLTASEVKNLTHDTLRSKVSVSMNVGYDADTDAARSIMVESARSTSHVITDDQSLAPYTKISGFADSNMEITLSFWVDDVNFSSRVTAILRELMFKRFKEAGIPMDTDQLIVVRNADA